MIKKRLKQGLVVISCVFITGQPALAAEQNDLMSDAKVEVLEGSMDAVPPKFGADPEDSNSKGTENTGLLKIDKVPNFVFGQVVSSGLYQAEFARNSNPYIQVSDLRGTLGGWTLYAKMSNFVSTRTENDTKKYVLNGATLNLKEGQIANYNSEEGAPPRSFEVSLNHEFQKIMSADNDAGQGIWATCWESQSILNENIELGILPGTAEAGRDYQATLYWQLIDVPK